MLSIVNQWKTKDGKKTHQYFVAYFPKFLFDTFSVLSGELLFTCGGFGFLFNWWYYSPWRSIWMTIKTINNKNKTLFPINFYLNVTFVHRLHFCKQLIINFFLHWIILRRFLWLLSWLVPYHRIWLNTKSITNHIPPFSLFQLPFWLFG